MTQLELASRAAAGAMGMNPATEWEKARPVAEAVLAVIQPNGVSLTSVPHDHADDPPEWQSGVVQTDHGATTSPEIASIAARLMDHEDPDVRRVAASALVQR